uniref:Uncharacterized protein n=1 Tax=Candidatus Kentrum sp. FM TaxID=2126340 RepID=A0A450SU28_9GAMM|nr:MAG: hypothetical protein BECKFM1743A_GA0114220_101911 [Candidatus Kentron sp. FM]
MTDLYAWNTARAGSIAHPNVAGRAYSTLQGRADLLTCSTNLSPNKKMRPLLVFIVQLVRAVTWLMRLPRALNPNENPAQFGIFFSANRLSRITATSTDRMHRSAGAVRCARLCRCPW